MQIVLVHWQIIPGRETEFQQYWKSGLPVTDRTGLVGEFLCELTGDEQYDWVTWNMRSSEDCSTFINVALWRDAETFHEQIGKYFNPARGTVDFELELRKRALLTPRCWRMGDWKLPIHDSGGVI